MIVYSVYVESHIAESFPRMKAQDRNILLRLMKTLRTNPFLEGDYTERDDIGRLMQVVVAGKHAVVFWADHAAKEVKVLDLRPAGR